MSPLGLSHAREHQKLQSRDDFYTLCAPVPLQLLGFSLAREYIVFAGPSDLKCSLSAKMTHVGDPRTAIRVIKVPSNCHQTLIAPVAF